MHDVNPELKQLQTITRVIMVGMGWMDGLFLYTWGPYFFDHFTGEDSTRIAITVTMILFAFRQGLVALLEVPVGALADTIGRGHTTVLSFAIRCAMFLSLALMAFCDQVYTAVFWASISSICYALNYTLFNGAFSAWCADTLRERSAETPFANLAARFRVHLAWGETLGAITAVWIYLQGFPFLGFLAGALSAYVMIGYGIAKLKEPRNVQLRPAVDRNMGTIIRDVGSRIADSLNFVKATPVIFWVVLVYGAYMFLLSLVLHLWPVYLRATTGAARLSVTWIGVTLATLVLQLAGAWCFAQLNDRWTRAPSSRVRFIRYRRVYMLSATGSAVAVLALGIWTYSHEAPLLVFTLAVGTVLFAWGWIGSCFDILVNSFIPREKAHDRATIVSAGSMVRSIITLILAVPSGGSSAETSPVGWAVPALLLLIATIGATRALRVDERRRDESSASNPLTPTPGDPPCDSMNA